jgi:hypothetical protein
VKIYNSILVQATFNQAYLKYASAEEVRGTQSGSGTVDKGWVFDYNTFVSPDILVKDRYRPYQDTGFGSEDIDFTSLAAWQAHAPPADGCGNCVNDPHSQHIRASLADFLVNPTNADLASDPPDYRLKPGSPGIDFGASAFGPSDGKDITGATRVGRPDAGAFEFNGTTGAVCGNGTIEGSEQCDGASLGGATCVTLGYGAGTLSCSSLCRYDTSGCPPAPTPDPPADVRRTDKKTP